MNRRDAIERTALILGYAITGPALIGVLGGCKANPELNFKPEFFSDGQAALISAMSEIIMPRTDTPGAKDVGVPMFIDQMLKSIYPKESQDAFIKNLADFDGGAQEAYGKYFVDCNEDEQLAYFKKHHDAALQGSTSGNASGWWHAGVKTDKPFIVEVKELTLLGFFTSEAGATQVLQYKQVPGPYKGCVPLAEVGKTWAT